MWANEAFWRLVPEDTLAEVRAADVPPDLPDVVRQGRVEDASGVWLLRAFRDSSMIWLAGLRRRSVTRSRSMYGVARRRRFGS